MHMNWYLQLLIAQFLSRKYVARQAKIIVTYLIKALPDSGSVNTSKHATL